MSSLLSDSVRGSTVPSTGILSLPDELLEIIVQRYFYEVGTVRGIYRPAYVHPAFPQQPFGAAELAGLRGSCRRLKGLVDAQAARRISIVICSDPHGERSQGAHRWTTLHPICGALGDASAMTPKGEPCWRTVQQTKPLAGTVQELKLTMCHVTDRLHDFAHLTGNEAQLAAVLSSLAASITRLEVLMYQRSHVWGGQIRHHKSAAIDLWHHIDFPALQALRLDDPSLYVYLPFLVGKAPKLRSVSLGHHAMRYGSGLEGVLKGRYGASPSRPLRLFPHGPWQELIFEMPALTYGSCVQLLRNCCFASRDVIMRIGYKSSDGEWRQNMLHLAGLGLRQCQFQVLRLEEEEGGADEFEGATTEFKNKFTADIRDCWASRGVHQSVDIVWASVS